MLKRMLMAAGSGVAGITKWDSTKKHVAVSLSNADKTMSTTGGSWAAVVANNGHNASKRQFELVTTGDSFNALAGCVNSSYTSYGTYIGEGTPGESAGYWFEQDRYVYYNGGNAVPNNGGITVSDVLGVCIDFDADTIKFYKNGVLAITMPAAFTTLGSSLWFPAASTQSSGNVTLRTSSLSFPIAGYAAWDD